MFNHHRSPCNGIISAVSIGITLLLSSFGVLPAQGQSLSEKIVAMEQGLEQEFESYFGADLAEVTQTPEDIAQTLSRLSAETGTRPAVLWVIPREDHLHLVLITPDGDPIVRDLPEVPVAQLSRTVDLFHLEMYDSPDSSGMMAAKQLYQWMIEPFEDDYLKPADIDTILFCLGDGVRSLPLAALYDGEQFLLEKYNLTRIPAFNLIQTDYVDLRQGEILAMGASEFESLNPLPAVPTELTAVVEELQVGRPPELQWQGQLFLNQEFTLAQFQQQLVAQSPTVVHLATHAVFQPGDPTQSYIQLWDSQLSLDAIRDVGWDLPQLQLLVLSACRTAVGDDQAELGFAGLALQAGVKSVVASVWNVSDTATLALMSEFYQQLGITSTKAEALRQAQLKLLRGGVRVEGDRLILSDRTIELPTELLQAGGEDLSAPYYWAGFTLISSPW